MKENQEGLVFIPYNIVCGSNSCENHKLWAPDSKPFLIFQVSLALPQLYGHNKNVSSISLISNNTIIMPM